MAERLLTAEEVAERLRLAPFTVRRMIRRGRIRAYKVGRAWRVPEEAVLEYLQTVGNVPSGAAHDDS